MNKITTYNLWRIFPLLLMLFSTSISMFAEGEYPNAMVINQTDGSQTVFMLEHTSLQFHQSSGVMKVITESDIQSFPISNVVTIAYEYRDNSSIGIANVTMSDNSKIEVYNLAGRKLLTNLQTMQDAFNALPKGIYIIKMKERTIKIVK